MKFWNKICGLTAIFFLCALFSIAQTGNYIKPPGTELTQKYLSKVDFNSNKTNTKEFPNTLRPHTIVAQDYYTQHFGIMCKKELALEKATKIPFRFRLGSLQQCNYLEGKR